MNHIMVKITKKDIEKAYDFAKKRSKDIKLYQSRGSFKLSDITTGALAEIACYKLLKRNGFEVSKPDFEIYDKTRKSYKADLEGDGRQYHVKGQMLASAEKYGCSWLMQRHDPIINNPERKHYLMPCVVDEEKMVVYVYGCVPMLSLVSEECIGECTVPSFRRTKVAIYLQDVTTLLTPSRRWSVIYKEIRE